MPFIPFKFKKANAPTRLAYFDTQPTWGDLASEIATLFYIPPKDVGVAFVDKHNDAVTLKNEKDLQRFYKLLDQSSEEIKFVVQDLRTPDAETTITSTWSMDSNMSELSKSDDEFKLFCWVLGRSNGSFSVKIGKSETVDDLKKEVKKENEPELDHLAAKSLKIWKLSPPIPSAELDLKLGHVRSPEEIPGSVQLDPFDDLSEHFLSPQRKHLHIVVQLPPIRSGPGKRGRSPVEEDGHAGLKRQAIDTLDTDHSWLKQLHSEIWNRPDRKSEFFYEVEVTVANYNALQERLTEKHRDRDLAEYRAKNVLSIKLDYLQSLKSCPSIPPPSPQNKANSVQIQANHDQDAEESNEDDSILDSFLPTTLEFLDLSSLKLKDQSRLPLPLLVRQDYKELSTLINDQDMEGVGSVMVCGQPGTGKTAYLHLKIVESIIAGRPFLYQTLNGTVYHVSDKLTEINSWSSTEPITAFIDADSRLGVPLPPRDFLFHSSVQIIVASSPAGSEARWLKQGGPFLSVTKLTAALWSPRELFLTGIFLHPRDLTFMRLKESASYFGNNPRQCFDASASIKHMYELKEEVISQIRENVGRVRVTSLLFNTRSVGGVSHRIFQISPSDENRFFGNARIDAVSSWALDILIRTYKNRQDGEMAEFFQLVTRMPNGETLHGHLFERQVLDHFDDIAGPHTFSIRNLSTDATMDWIYPGPAPRFTFKSSTVIGALTNAVENGNSLHLVPWDPNFPAVDSIVYAPNEVLTCVQVTINKKHAIKVSGLQQIQGWLKRNSPLEAFRPHKDTQKHWRFIFVVPFAMEKTFASQTLEDDTKTGEWAGKVDQYVLGLEEKTLFRMVEEVTMN